MTNFHWSCKKRIKIREMKVDSGLGHDKWVLVIHSGLPIPICHVLVTNPLSFHEFFPDFFPIGHDQPGIRPK